jgi:hypothetical protein
MRKTKLPAKVSLTGVFMLMLSLDGDAVSRSNAQQSGVDASKVKGTRLNALLNVIFASLKRLRK